MLLIKPPSSTNKEELELELELELDEWGSVTVSMLEFSIGIKEVWGTTLLLSAKGWLLLSIILFSILLSLITFLFEIVSLLLTGLII